MASFFAYSTPKQLVIKSKRLFLCFIAYMIICGAIVAGVMIYLGKDYSYCDRIESAVTIKVFGIIRTNFSTDQFKKGTREMELYNRIWGPGDYIVPHIEPTEVFIATNLIIQENQKLSKCAEDPEVPNSHCQLHRNGTLAADNCTVDVLRGSSGNDSNGVPTGKCKPIELENGNKMFTCEIEAWCPVLRQTNFPLVNDEPILRNVSEVEVVIANSVNFPVFNYKPIRTPEFRQFFMCNREDPRCPRFRLGTIIERANQTLPINKSPENVYKYGAILAIHVNWNNCIVDEECNPTYVPGFIRNPEANTYAHGQTFRYFELDRHGSRKRTLVKAYGIRIVVLVTGVAKKWDFLAFMLGWLTYGTALVLASSLFSCLVVNCNRRIVDEDATYPKVEYPCREEVGQLEIKPIRDMIPIRNCWERLPNCCLKVSKLFKPTSDNRGPSTGNEYF